MTSYTGATGPEGPTGFQGQNGIALPADTGPTGVYGFRGPTGDSDQGPTAMIGDTGIVGSTGPTGSSYVGPTGMNNISTVGSTGIVWSAHDFYSDSVVGTGSQTINWNLNNNFKIVAFDPDININVPSAPTGGYLIQLNSDLPPIISANSRNDFNISYNNPNLIPNEQIGILDLNNTNLILYNDDAQLILIPEGSTQSPSPISFTINYQ